jgi:hypothetical protein
MVVVDRAERVEDDLPQRFGIARLGLAQGDLGRVARRSLVCHGASPWCRRTERRRVYATTCRAAAG